MMGDACSRYNKADSSHWSSRKTLVEGNNTTYALKLTHVLWRKCCPSLWTCLMMRMRCGTFMTGWISKLSSSGSASFVPLGWFRYYVWRRFSCEIDLHCPLYPPRSFCSTWRLNNCLQTSPYFLKSSILPRVFRDVLKRMVCCERPHVWNSCVFSALRALRFADPANVAQQSAMLRALLTGGYSLGTL